MSSQSFSKTASDYWQNLFGQAWDSPLLLQWLRWGYGQWSASILGLALGLWASGLTDARLWYDEQFTQWVATLPLDRAMAALAGDVHPPLHYLIVWALAHIPALWGGAAWAGAVVLRGPSVLFSTLSLALLLFGVGPQLRLKAATTLTAGLLMALAPFQLHYAQEARMYALLQLLFLGGWWAAQTRRYALLALCGAGLLLTHNYGFFYLAALFIPALWHEANRPRHWAFDPHLPQWPTIKDQENVRGVVIAAVAAFAAYLPWLAVLLGQMKAQQSGWWQLPTLPGAVVSLPWFLLFDESNMYGSFLYPQWIIAGSLFTIGLYRQRDVAWYVLVPMACALVVETVYRPVWLPRAFIGAAPACYLLFAVALESVAARWQRVAIRCLTIGLLVLGLAAFIPLTTAYKGAPVPVASVPGALVYHVNPGTLVAYQSAGAQAVHVHAPFAGDQGTLTTATLQAFGADVRPLESLYWRRAVLVWGQTPTTSPAQAAYVARLLATYPNRKVEDLTVPWAKDLTGGGIWILENGR